MAAARSRSCGVNQSKDDATSTEGAIAVPKARNPGHSRLTSKGENSFKKHRFREQWKPKFGTMTLEHLQNNVPRGVYKNKGEGWLLGSASRFRLHAGQHGLTDAAR